MFLPICNFDGHVWPRKKCLFYVSWGQGGDYTRYRLRFCPAHAADIDQDLSEFEISALVGAAGGSHMRLANCFACRQPLSEIGRQVFITGYPTQDERKDYWGGLHDDHHLPIHLQDPYLNAAPQ